MSSYLRVLTAFALPILAATAPLGVSSGFAQSYVASPATAEAAYAAARADVARLNPGPPVEVHELALWRLGPEMTTRMRVTGMLTSTGPDYRQVKTVELLIKDRGGALLQTVNVETANLPKGGRRPFSVDFAMRQAPSGPVRIRVGKVENY